MKLIFGSVFGFMGAIFIIIGCPFIGIAGIMYYTFVQNTQNWVLVPGTVTAMSESQTYDSDGGGYSTNYCPTVAYQTTDGQSIEEEINECSTPPAYSVGDGVEVYYNPANSHDAQLKGGVKSSLGNLFLIIFGGLGTLFCLGGGGSVIAAVVIAVWPKTNPLGNQG